MKHLKKLTILHLNDMHGDFWRSKSTKNDEIISSFVDIGEAAREVNPPSRQSEKHPEGCFSYLFRR